MRPHLRKGGGEGGGGAGPGGGGGAEVGGGEAARGRARAWARGRAGPWQALQVLQVLQVVLPKGLHGPVVLHDREHKRQQCGRAEGRRGQGVRPEEGGWPAAEQ